MSNRSKTSFAPVLMIPGGTTDVEFYKHALNATEVRRFSNKDGSIHVVEFTIDDTMFHLHEENYIKKEFSPLSCNGITANIGLFVLDVDTIMEQAVKAGAKEISMAQDYNYGLRQGEIADPFGHHWTIQKMI